MLGVPQQTMASSSNRPSLSERLRYLETDIVDYLFDERPRPVSPGFEFASSPMSERTQAIMAKKPWKKSHELGSTKTEGATESLLPSQSKGPALNYNLEACSSRKPTSQVPEFDDSAPLPAEMEDEIPESDPASAHSQSNTDEANKDGEQYFLRQFGREPSITLSAPGDDPMVEDEASTLSRLDIGERGSKRRADDPLEDWVETIHGRKKLCKTSIKKTVERILEKGKHGTRAWYLCQYKGEVPSAGDAVYNTVLTKRKYIAKMIKTFNDEKKV